MRLWLGAGKCSASRVARCRCESATRPRAGSVVTFTESKTEASTRVIPLPDAVLTGLAAHLWEYGEHESGLIFTTAFGGPVRPSALWMAWSDALVNAGVSGVKFHDLRPTTRRR